jgi:hypothetical protein
MVDLLKRHWRLEIWCDRRMTDAEFEAFAEAVAEVVCDERWPHGAGMIGSLKEINED